MTEKRFKLAYKKDDWWAVQDGEITLWKEEVIHLLNELHEENEGLKKENNQLQRYVYHCPQTCRIILAYLKKCGSENVKAVNKAMDIVEYFDEEIDTLRL